jgi:acetolactate synthase-1/2/3 large subunit
VTRRAHELTCEDQLEGFTRELIREASDPRHPGPVLLAVPADMWHLPCRVRAAVSTVPAFDAALASDWAKQLRSARRPLIVAGAGVMRANAVDLLADLLGCLPRARVALTPRGQGCFPRSDSRCAGVIGFGGTLDAELEVADLLLVLGSRLHEMSTNFDDRLFDKAILHADINPHEPGRIFPAEGAHGDLRFVLASLIREMSVTSSFPRSALPSADRASQRGAS